MLVVDVFARYGDAACGSYLSQLPVLACHMGHAGVNPGWALQLEQISLRSYRHRDANNDWLPHAPLLPQPPWAQPLQRLTSKR